MKLIDAYWEKRNLDVDCQELVIDMGDSLTEIEKVLKNMTAQYQVLKIPTGNTEALFFAQSQGFTFIETNIQLKKKLDDDVKLPDIYQRFAPYISFHEADHSEVLHTLDEVRNGEMFITDKIACDPYFSTRLSGRRYALWSEDVLNKGNKLFISDYKNEAIAFSINIKKDTYYDAFLGGVFPKYKYQGFGFIPLYTNIKTIQNQGGKIVKTGVSSNNMPILRLHLLYGFMITEMKNILIKHIFLN